MSLPWQLLGGLVAALALFFGGYGLGNKHAKTECVAGQVKAQRDAVTEKAKEEGRREAVGTAREASREQIRIVYRTLREQAHEVVAHHSEFNDCDLDADGLRIWNAANSGSAASVSGQSHDALSNSLSSQVGQDEGFIEQSRRGDGAVRAMPRPVE